MTFPTKTREQEQLEQRQRDHNVAEGVATISYIQHPADDEQAARSLMRALPWPSDQCSDFIAQHGQRLRELAAGVVAKANALGVTPEEAIRLESLANATGITVAEAAAQKAARAATAASAAKEGMPLAQSMRAALAAISSYAILPGDDRQAMKTIVWSVSGWSVVQADAFITEFGPLLQTVTGEVQAIATAADRSSAIQAAKVLNR